jgi:peptidylprolyl isomerase domain and WD repeat-containing protein 1
MSLKRSHEDSFAQESVQNGNESDDYYGPMPIANEDDLETKKNDDSSNIPKKSRKVGIPSHLLQLYTDNLPKSAFYEHSYMHRDVVTHIVVSKPTEFVITASCDGHVKFWKKMKDNIEFVKHFQAHLGRLSLFQCDVHLSISIAFSIGPINCLSLSYDGTRLLTTSEDKTIKFFEVIGFDLSHMITLSYVPTAAEWMKTVTTTRVAVADANAGTIRIYRSEDSSHGDMNEPLASIELHRSPVKSIIFNPSYACAISIDMSGMIEYWDVNTYDLPNKGKSPSFRSVKRVKTSL